MRFSFILENAISGNRLRDMGTQIEKERETIWMLLRSSCFFYY